MATIGRKKAVVEIGKLKFGGFLAWMLWRLILKPKPQNPKC